MLNAAVVDPDSGSLKIVACLLERNAQIASVTCFSSLPDYVSELEKGSIHIAFIRVGSPGFHGLSLARETSLVSPATRVVFMSDTERYAVMAFEERACGYLLLPAQQKDLDEVLDNVRRRKNWR